MTGVKRIMLIVSLIAVICRGGCELQGITAQYVKEARVKESVAGYRPEEAEGERYRPEATLALPDEEPGEGAEAEGAVELPVPELEAEINQSIVDLQNEVNDEIVGWLYIPDTQIDYPFVWSGDHETYLKQDLYGNQANAGTLFMDYRSAKDLSGFNTIIYGHHMKNGSMFGELKLFADEGFFESNPRGSITLKDKACTLEIFAYMVVRADDEMIYGSFPERNGFYEYIKENAGNYREPDREKNVVTLSTCSYEFTDARMVLLANIV